MAINKNKISVIIPVFNEETEISKLLDQLIRFNADEVIVVDGGSSDQTVEIVRKYYTIKLISSRKGRAFQMNNGAEEATGDILLFLHADSRLPVDAFDKIRRSLIPEDVFAGSFYLSFRGNNFLLKVYGVLSRLNHFLLTFGDQGFFIKREHFIEIDGYKEIPLLEDFDLQRRVRKRGKFVKLNCPVTTSARRFNKNGIIWQQVKNIFIVGLYLIGVPATRLAKFY